MAFFGRQVLKIGKDDLTNMAVTNRKKTIQPRMSKEPKDSEFEGLVVPLLMEHCNGSHSAEKFSGYKKPFGPVHIYMPRLTERVTPPISLAKCGHFPSSCLTAKSTLIVSSRQ